MVLPGHQVEQIPLFLQPHTASHYRVTAFTLTGADELLRVILRQPGYVVPAVGSEPLLAPHSGQPEDARADQAVPPTGRTHVVNQVNGTVNGKIIQVETIEGDVIF